MEAHPGSPPSALGDLCLLLDLHAGKERWATGQLARWAESTRVQVFAPSLGDLDLVAHADFRDPEHAVVVHDLAAALGGQPVGLTRDVSGFQRTAQVTRQSATGGGDQVVQGGGERVPAGAHVVIGDLGVDAEVRLVDRDLTFEQDDGADLEGGNSPPQGEHEPAEPAVRDIHPPGDGVVGELQLEPRSSSKISASPKRVWESCHGTCSFRSWRTHTFTTLRVRRGTRSFDP